MEFNVAQLLREPVGSRREYEVADACSVEALTSKLRGNVELLRTDAGVLASARLATTLETTCSRCLEPARLPVTLQIEEEYYPTIDVLSGAPLPPAEEPTPFMIDEHHILDLCEAVRQQIVLAEPMQPLCRPDCAGLCPACGANLNDGPCVCPPLDVDTRWAGLRDLVALEK